MLKECFQDLEASGPANALSQEMQVEKLVQSFQFPPLAYLRTIISNDPRYSNNFNSAAGLILSEMTGLKLQNGNRNATIASLTATEDVEMEDATTAPRKVKQLQRKVKKLEAKFKKQNNKKVPAYKKSPKAKFNKADPVAYLDSKAFNSLTDEQRAAIKKARREAGIPVRGVGSVTTRRAKSAKAKEQPESQSDKDLPRVSNDPGSLVNSPQSLVKDFQSLKVVDTVPASLLQAPKRGLVTTQREALYSLNTSNVRKVSFAAKTKPGSKE